MDDDKGVTRNLREELERFHEELEIELPEDNEPEEPNSDQEAHSEGDASAEEERLRAEIEQLEQQQRESLAQEQAAREHAEAQAQQAADLAQRQLEMTKLMDNMTRTVGKITTELEGVSRRNKEHIEDPSNAPQMGRSVVINGNRMIKMGGIPNVSWSGLQSESIQTHSGQYRSWDKTKGHKISSQLTGLDPKWKKTTRLTVLQKHLLNTLTKFGMEQHCYVKHPHKDDVLNIVEHPHVVSHDMDFVGRITAEQTKCYNEWDKENAQHLKQLLLDSLDPKVQEKVSSL